MDVCFASCLCGYSIVKFVHIDAVGGILLWRCQICGTKLFLRVSYPPAWWSHHLESHHSVVSHSVLFTIRWFHIQFFSLFGGFTFSSFHYSVVGGSCFNFESCFSNTFITATLNNPAERAKHSIIFYNNSYQRTEKTFLLQSIILIVRSSYVIEILEPQ